MDLKNNIFAHNLRDKYKGQFRSVSQEVKVRLLENKLVKKNFKHQ